MANGETFKASIIGSLSDGTGIVFDFGYADTSGTSTHLDTGTAAGDFQTLMQDDLVPLLPDDYTFVRYRFACVGGTHKGELTNLDVASPVTGSASAVNRHPNELCVSIKRSTGFAARNERGRVFFGPIPTVAMDNANINKIIPTFYADVVALVKANLTTQGVTLKPVILNSAGAYSGHAITQSSAAPVIVHRKSRRPRVGA